MMDATLPMPDVTSLLASGLGENNETAVSGGGLVDMLSAPSSTSDYNSYESDMPSLEDENWIRVPANWLDAMPADRYDDGHKEDDAISAVNSDDNGLYRMFRNLSP